MNKGALLLLAAAISACSGASIAPPHALPKKAEASPAPAGSSALVGLWDVRWHRCKTGWKPPTLVMRLRIKGQGGGMEAELSSPVVRGSYSIMELKVKGDRIEATFTHDRSKFQQRIWATVRGDRLVGEMRTKEIGWTPFIAHKLDLAPSSEQRPLPRAEPSKSGVDMAAFNALLERAAMERSSALVIIKDGKIIAERYREGADKPIVAMSASKSVVSMAVGHLIGSGKLSLDTPMGELFKRWKGDPRGKITVRQLLNHTSGLQLRRAYEKKQSILEYTLGAKLLHEPGTVWQYSNGGVDFLAAVVHRASGMQLDAYLEEHLFKQIGVQGARWFKDPAGMPMAAGELVIRPSDFALLGQVMLDGGQWKGAQILPASWVDSSLRASQEMRQDYGLLWWRSGEFQQEISRKVLAAWSKVGVPKETVKKLLPLVGQRFAGRKAYWAAVVAALGKEGAAALEKLFKKIGHAPPPNAVQSGEVHAYSARGWKGQYLVVVPKARLVALRMRWPEKVDNQWSDIDYWRDFEADVLKLVGLAAGKK